MPEPKVNTFVWLHPDHAEKLREMARQNARFEAAWLLEQRDALGLSEREPTPEELRLDILDLRPNNWPGESHLVTAAMRRRMTEDPLADPWPPFTEAERKFQRLAGRRTGTPNEGFGDKIALDLPADLVESAQLAAYRISQPIVATLRAENLIGRNPKRSREALARKRQLQADIYTLGRIIRESITKIVAT